MSKKSDQSRFKWEGSHVRFIDPKKVKRFNAVDDVVLNYNEEHDELGRFARKGSGKKLSPVEKYLSTVDNSKYSKYNELKVGNVVQAKLYDVAGYHALPKVVSTKEYETLTEDEYIKTYRGVIETDDTGSVKDNHRYGEYNFVGEGVYGDGTYVSYDKYRASFFANDNTLLRIAIPKTARIVSLEEAENGAELAREQMKAPYKTDSWGLPDPSLNLEERRAIQHHNWLKANFNSSAWAILNGYDAIDVDGGHTHIVLNRGITVMDEGDYYEPSRNKHGNIINNAQNSAEKEEQDMSADVSRRVGKAVKYIPLQNYTYAQKLDLAEDIENAVDFEDLTLRHQADILASELNAYELFVMSKNSLGYNPNRDKKDGRFTTGTGGKKDSKKVKGRPATSIKNPGKYPGRQKGESFEEYGYRYMKENPEEALETYEKLTLKEFNTPRPNIVAADEAKKIIPGFDAERSSDYHEPASGFVKDYYKKLLADDSTKDLPVLFTAGGTGAGKSTALSGNLNSADGYGGYTAVYDGNMAGFESAKGKVEAARATGREVEIVFVDRDIVTSFKYGVLPRIKKEGRAITIRDHLQTHFDSRKAGPELAEAFKDDPGVTYRVIDNNGGLGEAHEVPLDNLTKKEYNRERVRKDLEDEARKYFEEGNISEGVYKLIIGNEETVSNRLDVSEPQGSEAGQGRNTSEEILEEK